jgi:hypothetical protein
MASLVWPVDVRPYSQEFFIETNVSRFTSLFTKQSQLLERQGKRWVSVVSFRGFYESALRIESLLAKMNGGVTTVLMPDFRRLAPLNPLNSIRDYYTESGTTTFTDGATFDDGAVFFSGTLADYLADIEIYATGFDNEIFYKGAFPLQKVVNAGEILQTSEGRVHMIIDDSTADSLGNGSFKVYPTLKTFSYIGSRLIDLMTAPRVLMRVTANEYMRNSSSAPFNSEYNFSMVEEL